MDAEKKVINTLKKAKEPLKNAQIAEASGVDSKEVTKVINKLKKDGMVTSPKRCFYSLA